MAKSLATWWILLPVAIAAYGCASESGHREGAVPLHEVPAEVQGAVNRAVGPGKLERITKEMENGQAVYEAEIEDPGDVDRSVTISMSGQVLEEETEIEMKDAPAAVLNAVKSKYPSATIKEVSRVKAGGASYYEVEAKEGGRNHEVRVDASGRVLGEEIESTDGNGKKGQDKEDKD